MQERTVDLRNLVKQIVEQKQLNANLSLEFDCTLQTTDHIPLVKVINYIMNYLSPLSSNKMEISLNAAEDSYLLSFIVATDKTELEPINEQVKTVLADYHGTLSVIHEQGKYVQIQVKFE
ncbi:MAG: hypothetical protein KDD94_08360 [Calditrichaeota bacterium]|nr:hypothetical protein [Calditrichota bacterium]